MKREVQLAKKLLEGKGYKVSKMNEAGWMKNHPGYDPIGAPARPDENDPPFDVPTMTPEDMKAIGAVQASEVKAGDTIKADFDASEIDLGEFYTVEEVLDDGEGMGDLTFVCDNGMKLHFDRDDFVGYKVDPKDIPAMRKSRAEYDLKSYESKEIEEHLEVAPNHTSTTAEKVAYVKKMVKKAIEEGDEHSAWDIVDFLYDSLLLDEIPLDESEEVLKPQYESNDLKYVCNTNGYSCYRKLENGKGVWFAKRQDDPDDKMFPISYEQARGFKEMPDETEIEKLQREMGKMLLPESESTATEVARLKSRLKEINKAIEKGADPERLAYEKEKIFNRLTDLGVDDWYDEKTDEGILDKFKKKKSKSGDAMRDRAKDVQSDIDDIKSQVDKMKTLRKSIGESSKNEIPHTSVDGEYTIQTYGEIAVYKDGKKVAGPFSDMADAKEWISELDESRTPLQKALLKSIKRLHESDTIYITKPDDLVGHNPKFKVTYSTAKGETTSHYIEATDENSVKAIITGRCRRRGKTPKFISIEKVSESLGEGLNYEEMRYWNPVAIGSKVAKALGDVSEEELRDEIAKIINDEYDRGDIESSRERALQSAMRELNMERELTQRDPMNGHKYQVGGSTPNVTDTGTDYDIHDGGYTDDPKSAITTWLQLSQKNPTMISIDTNKNAYAQELLQWVVDNEEEFRSLCAQYRCPYKVDYMIDGCKKKLERPSNFETKYNYPDQIYPFALG